MTRTMNATVAFFLWLAVIGFVPSTQAQEAPSQGALVRLPTRVSTVTVVCALPEKQRGSLSRHFGFFRASSRHYRRTAPASWWVQAETLTRAAVDSRSSRRFFVAPLGASAHWLLTSGLIEPASFSSGLEPAVRRTHTLASDSLPLGLGVPFAVRFQGSLVCSLPS